MAGAKDSLAFWDALKPKITQLIGALTKSAVRKKKMTISAIDTAAQTVTVYESADSTNTITIPYRAHTGIGKLSAGQSVIVEWIFNDLSTAIAVSPGKGYGTGSKILWENSTIPPTSSFAAQTLSVSNGDLADSPSNYDEIRIDICEDATDSASSRRRQNSAIVGYFDGVVAVPSIMNNDSVNIETYFRFATINSSSITFTIGHHGSETTTNTSNSVAVPVRIVGINYT